MPLEPSRLQFASSHLASYDDLKGALTKLNWWWLLVVSEVFSDQVVQPVALSVEFFLEGDHATEQISRLVFVFNKKSLRKGKAGG